MARQVNLKAQVAARRLFLNARGQLNPDATTLAVALRRRCGAQTDRIVIPGPNGIDVNATIASAATREVWEWLVRLIMLEAYDVANIQEDT